MNQTWITNIGNTAGAYYLYTFTEIIYAYLKLPIEYQLFGIPYYEKLLKYTWSFELHYMIEIIKNGLFFYSLIIGLNLYILIRACVGKYRHNHLILINIMVFTLLL